MSPAKRKAGRRGSKSTGASGGRKTVRKFIDARRQAQQAEKKAVAAYVNKHYLKGLETVLLDSGSACEAIAREMAKRPDAHFTVLTNNMGAVLVFMQKQSRVRLHLTGGFYRDDDAALIGTRAVHSLEDFFVKYAIVGVSGITPTHVFCHGIEGEEQLKKAFWRMPAELVIVPATLDKLDTMDSCCFGALFSDTAGGREGLVESVGDPDASCPPAPSDGMPDSPDRILDERIEQVRRHYQERRLMNLPESLRLGVPGFTAKSCEIIVEPREMIDKKYARDTERRDRLIQVVDQMNARSNMTKVRVVYADPV